MASFKMLIKISVVLVVATSLINCSKKTISSSYTKVVKVEELFCLEGPKVEAHRVFHRIMDGTVDSEKNIFVVDAGASRIYKFDRNGNFVLSMGRFGQGPGDLGNSILGIAVDNKHNNVFIADIINNRLSKFDDAGRFITSCITSGGSQVITSPTGIIYVWPGKQGYILDKFDANLNYVGSIISDKILPSHVRLPTSVIVCIDKDDQIYILVNEKKEIYKYDTAGKFISKWAIGIPHFVENYNKRYKKMRELKKRFGVRGGGLLPFTDMEIDPEGNLCLMYIYEYENGDNGGVVYRYRPNGSYLDRIEGFGGTFGPFDIDSEGNYWCFSYSEHKVKKYKLSSQGEEVR